MTKLLQIFAIALVLLIVATPVLASGEPGATEGAAAAGAAAAATPATKVPCPLSSLTLSTPS